MTETRVLIVVGVQPTFCEDGALTVEGGNATAERVADFVTESTDKCAMIVTIQDWHVNPGSHSSKGPDFIDTWLPYALVGTAKIELYEAVVPLPIDATVRKDEYEVAYSDFEDRDVDGRFFEEILRAAEIEEVNVVGIVESHYVRETTLDALKAGWLARVLSDLTVPVSEEFGIAVRTEIDEAGVKQVAPMSAFGSYEEGEDAPILGDDASPASAIGGDAYGSLYDSDGGYVDGIDIDTYGEEEALRDGDPRSDGGDRYGDLDEDGEEPDLAT